MSHHAWKFLRIALFIVLIAGLALPAAKPARAADPWYLAGLADQDIRAVAVSPSNPSIIYAGSSGVDKSIDGGLTWYLTSTGRSVTINALVVHPTNPNIAYAATGSAQIIKTIDGGNTWIPATSGMIGAGINCLAIDPLNPETLYAGISLYNYYGSYYYGVYKTTNGGGFWTLQYIGYNTPAVLALAINPLNPAEIYAGTVNAIYKTVNGGASWIGLLSTSQINDLAVDPVNPANVYAATYGSGLLKSTSGGAAWARINPDQSPYTYGVAVNRSDPSRVYFSVFYGVFQSLNGGTTWEDITAGLPNRRIRPLVINPSESILYAGCNPMDGAGTVGLYMLRLTPPPPVITTLVPAVRGAGEAGFTLTVNGSNFASGAQVLWDGIALATTRLNAGRLTAEVPAGLLASPAAVNITVSNPEPAPATSPAAVFTVLPPHTWYLTGQSGLSVSAVALAPSNPAIMYSGSNGIDKSTDGGFTWAVTAAGHASDTVYALVVHPTNPDIVYAGTAYSNVIRSTDGGASWAQGAGLPGTQVYALVMDPLTPTTLYAGVAGYGVFKSTNAGLNWAQTAAGLTPDETINALAINPLNPAEIYAAGYFGLYKTTSAGQGWNLLLGNGLINGLAIDPLTPATVYAATYGTGLLKTTNGGLNWARINPDQSPYTYAVAVDPFQPEIVYYSVFFGVFQSGDRGATWRDITAGLPNRRIRPLVIHPADSRALFAGQITTDGEGTPGLYTVHAPSPLPTLAGLTPAEITAGSDGFTLALDGADFADGASARWNGDALATTYLGPTHLTAEVPAARVALAGTASITVSNPDGGTSQARTFTVNNPAPALTALSPASQPVGGAAFTLQVSGAGFVPGSQVRWNNSPLTTTYIDPAHLGAAVPAASLTTPASVNITVVNPAPGGGTSAALTFRVVPPPALTALSPVFTFVGEPDFTLTLTGTNFTADSTALWGALPLATTYLSPTRLTAVVPASLLAAEGAISVTVTTPGVGTTAAQPFNVRPVGQWFNAGLPAEGIIALVADPSNPDVLYAGGASGRVFKSSDAGSTWDTGSLVTSAHPIYNLTVDPSNSLVLYASTNNGGVFRSLDGGVTWSAKNTGLPVLDARAVVVNSLNPAVIYLATYPNGIYKSTNRGDTWQPAGTQPSTQTVTLAIDPLNPNRLYSAVWDNHIIRSTDGGDTWQTVFTGPGCMAYAIAVSRADPARVMAGLNCGSRLTTNGGDTWTATMWSGYIYSAAFDPVDAETMYVGQRDGRVLRSAGGGPWVDYSTGLTFSVMNINALVVHAAHRSVIYAGVNGGVMVMKVPTPISYLVSLSPTRRQLNSGAFTLTVNGTAFAPGAVVRLNGLDLPTTYVSPTRLTAEVPASALTATGTVAVSVVYLNPGSGTGNTLPFTVIPVTRYLPFLK